MSKEDDVDINGRFLYYNKVIGLRNSKIITPVTPAQIVEIHKCKNDFMYFCENYFTIITLDEGETLFKPYDYQREFADLINNNRFIVGMLARQLGKGTIVTAWLTWIMLFESDYYVIYLANNHSNSIEMLRRIKLAYNLLPMWMQVGVKKWNDQQIEFENGNRLKAAACTAESARGSAANCIVLDEFAFVSNTITSEFLASVIPALGSGSKSKLIMFSTPNGFNTFSKIFMEAVKGKNDFKYIKYDWRAIPSRDEKWAKNQRDIIGDEKFKQEHELEILGSSATLLDGATLGKLVKERTIYETDELKIYEHPQPGHKYIMGVDVGRGLKRDFSVCQIVDVTETPYKQVAMYRNNSISYLFFPVVARELAVKYNNAFTIVEGNDLGEAVSDALWYGSDKVDEYENILYTSRDPNSKKTVLGGDDVGTFRTCLITTKTTKLQGCKKLNELIKYDKLIINDSETISEFYTFIEHRGSYAAIDPDHDDTIMALMTIAWVLDQDFFIDEINNNVYGNIVEENFELLPYNPDGNF